MITNEIRKYEIHGARIYIYCNVHVGVTYSAKVCTNTKRSDKAGFRWSENAIIWADKEAKRLEDNND